MTLLELERSEPEFHATLMRAAEGDIDMAARLWASFARVQVRTRAAALQFVRFLDAAREIRARVPALDGQAEELAALMRSSVAETSTLRWLSDARMAASRRRRLS